MNKRKKVAIRKHRAADKKLRIKRKAEAAATTSTAKARG
jgi:hypothetical protein